MPVLVLDDGFCSINTFYNETVTSTSGSATSSRGTLTSISQDICANLIGARAGAGASLIMKQVPVPV